MDTDCEVEPQILPDLATPALRLARQFRSNLLPGDAASDISPWSRGFHPQEQEPKEKVSPTARGT